jgi:hypothetical protein
VNNINTWIEHLHYPLVFAGFGLFIFATVIKLILLNSEKLNGTAKERVMTRGMYLAFILALLAIIGGVALNWQRSSTDGKQSRNSSESAQPITQQPTGAQKPASSSLKEPTAEKEKGANLSITASGQGQVSVGGDVINAEGNVEKNDGE